MPRRPPARSTTRGLIVKRQQARAGSRSTSPRRCRKTASSSTSTTCTPNTNRSRSSFADRRRRRVRVGQGRPPGRPEHQPPEHQPWAHQPGSPANRPPPNPRTDVVGALAPQPGREGQHEHPCDRERHHPDAGASWPRCNGAADHWLGVVRRCWWVQRGRWHLRRRQ